MPKITVGISCFVLRVLNRFFGTRDLPYLKAGINGNKKHMRARFGIDSMHGMPEITVGITGLSVIRLLAKFWVGITGLKNPVGDFHN